MYKHPTWKYQARKSVKSVPESISGPYVYEEERIVSREESTGRWDVCTLQAHRESLVTECPFEQTVRRKGKVRLHNLRAPCRQCLQWTNMHFQPNLCIDDHALGKCGGQHRANRKPLQNLSSSDFIELCSNTDQVYTTSEILLVLHWHWPDLWIYFPS